MTTLATAWMLAGLISCLIAVAKQRHALRSLAMGIVRVDTVQVLIAALGLGLLIIAGPIGLVWLAVAKLEPL